MPIPPIPAQGLAALDDISKASYYLIFRPGRTFFEDKVVVYLYLILFKVSCKLTNDDFIECPHVRCGR